MSMRCMTITDSVTMVTEECCHPGCGVLFAVTRGFRQECLDSPGPRGRTFYCPNGHRQWYTGKTDEQKAKERAARLERELANEQEYSRSLYADREAERRQHAATKGQLTKARKKVVRAEKGVCTCCNRSFANVAGHMERQHPKEFAASTAVSDS